MAGTRSLTTAAALLALAAACNTDASAPGDEPDPGAVVRIVSPSQGALIVRDVITAEGARIAPVAIEAEAEAGLDIELWLDGSKLADGATYDLALERAGFYQVEARAVDGGEVVGTTTVDFAVDEPRFSTCDEWLDLYDIPFGPGPVRQGVEYSITTPTPIAGIDYRYRGDAALRTDLSADCWLILALAEAAPILKRRDVVEVIDIGVYNYRCIGGGTPPDCPEGISQHALAKAIDMAAFVTSTGETYTVADDWVIDADATCTSATESEHDAFLHEIICAQKAAGIWNIVLTPNFNADHRDHFHVDLTEGANYTRLAPGPDVDVDFGPDDF